MNYTYLYFENCVKNDANLLLCKKNIAISIGRRTRRKTLRRSDYTKEEEKNRNEIRMHEN